MEIESDENIALLVLLHGYLNKENEILLESVKSVQGQFLVKNFNSLEILHI
jgi:hypothetical protein